MLKPSPYTPLTTLKVGELLRDVFPPGVLNIVSGGDELGAVDDLAPGAAQDQLHRARWRRARRSPWRPRPTSSASRWSSAATTRPSCSTTPIRPRSASAIFAGAFANNGQVCSAIKRVYVPEALYDDVVEGLAAHARSIKVGEGTEDGVKLGPINNAPQYERVKELVADALSSGPPR